MSLVASLTPIRANLPRAVGNARRGWLTREGLRLHVSDGALVGRAEAAPLPGFSPDSLDEARAALAAVPWSSIDLDGDDPLSIAARVVGEASPSARFAVEAALLDLAARRRGVPVCAMLGATRGIASIGSAALLDELGALVPHALSALAAGATTLKVKIGRAGREEDEIAALRALRREVGDDVRVRVDANGALRGADDPRIAACAEIHIEFCEEPFAVEALLEGPPLPIPVALDESLARTPDRALRALERGRAATLVLKPAMLGGLGRSLAFAEAAHARGARAVVSHLFDPPRAFAACGHLALAVGDEVVHGLASYPGLAAWTADDGAAEDVPRAIGAYRIERSATAGLG